MIFWLYLILIFLNFCSGTIEEDLKTVLELSDAAPNCTFNYTEVNSKTIKFFPKCEKVYGFIVINQNTDLSLKQLEKAFKNMTTLVGGIHVENSSLSSLSFLSLNPSSQRFSLSCNYYGVYIQNNKNLNDTNILGNLSPLWLEDLNYCVFEISNNPKLDLSNLCWSNSLKTIVNLKTSGNLVNCGCQGDQIYTISLEEIERCSDFYNGVSFHNFSESTKLETFSKIETIRGFMDVQNTNIQNLSFLSSLKYLKVYTKREEVILNLKNIPNMTRLEFPIMKYNGDNFENFNLYGLQAANFENLHPDFCLTPDEFYWFYNHDFHFSNLHANLCQIFDSDDVVCYFVSMSELVANCRYIIGDIIINSGDEDDVTKLSRLWYLYGTLTIQNTKLEDLSFFPYLMFIADLNSTRPVVQILNNRNLTTVKISSVKTIFTREFDNRVAIIQDNHPDMWNATNGTCNLFGIIPNENMMYRRSLNYTGGDCGERVEIKFGQRGGFSLFVLMVLMII